MQIVVSNVLTVSDATQEFRDWCRKHLRIPNPEYAQRLRMGFYIGNTPRELSMYEIKGNDYILPFGVLKNLPEEIQNTAQFVSQFAPVGKVDYEGDVPLYDYQAKAVKAMIDAKYGILESPAGSGKTQMGIAMVFALKRPTLWLCHTLDLVKQSEERMRLYLKNPDVIGTIREGKVNIGSGITFATVQTMSKIDLAQYKDYWDCIIVDEVHRVSGSPMAVTQYRKVLNSLSARHKYGLSATVHRSDGMIRATFSLTGDVAYTVPKSEIAEKIMDVGIQPIATGVTISPKALNTDGTLNYSKLITYITEHDERNQLIVSQIEEKSSLILSDRLVHLETLMKMLPDDMRKDAVMVSGKMTTKKGKKEREQAIEDMRTGKKKYLFATYSLAKEGLDIPCLERLYMTTPQKDFSVITQSIGRIARTSEGKDKPVAYDFVDNIIYLQRSYKKRCSIYRKNGCYFL